MPFPHRSSFRSRTCALAVAATLLSGAAIATTDVVPAIAALMPADDAAVSGDTMQWHRTTVSFSGPQTSESALVNPFLDYRLDVTFTQGSRSITVPGFYAGDGSGGGSGDQWQANFAPPTTGRWTYEASFRSGANVSVAADPNAGNAAFFDGESGSFDVAPSDKPESDFRNTNNGRITNTGGHYLTFEGSGDAFIKGGANIPENFLGYVGFDNTPDAGHDFDSHVGDWNPGDPDWDSPDNPGLNDGRAIIGALNYLNRTGANNIYFLPMNLGGDGRDTFPMVSETERSRYDLSKLDQWGMVFDHAQAQGIYLHIVLAETEPGNENFFDNGQLGNERRLFYRELVARFGHNLGVEWDIGEENDYGTARHREFADYLKSIDGYDNAVTTHTHTNRFEEFYGPLLGNEDFDITAFQGTQSRTDMSDLVIEWRDRSAAAGTPLVVSMDEPQPIHNDLTDTTRGYIAARRDKMWPLYMSGGGGFEWYVQQDGGGHSFDQQIDDFSILGPALTWTGYATGFFDVLPVQEMAPNHNLGSGPTGNTYVLAKPGESYAVFNDRTGSNLRLDLRGDSATYIVSWFNPRTGEYTRSGSVTGGATVDLGSAPNQTGEDWAVMLTLDGTVPPTTQAPTTQPPTTAAPTSQAPTTAAPTTGNLIDGFVLVDADSDTDIAGLTDGAVINLADVGSSITIRANAGADTSSVRFGLDGNQRFRLENVAPFALFGDTDGDYFDSWEPTLGTHTISATPYTEQGASGSAGESRTITVTIIDDATVPTTAAPTTTAPTTVPSSDISGFVLVDSNTDQDLGALVDGSVIDLSAVGSSLNVRADAAASVESVRFDLNGNRLRVENIAPYALAGDRNSDYLKWSPAPGTYTIAATPFGADGAQGTAGTTRSITVQVVRSSTSPTTQAPTTQPPTTQPPTTQAPTTQAPTTQAPTTQAPTTQPSSDGAFQAVDGVVVVESESLNAPSPWTTHTQAGRSSIKWGGSNNFGTPGNGTITVQVQIDEPGSYRFQWYNAFGEGTNPTESNDSWLRIHGDSFYGERGSSIKCPRHPLPGNDCSGPIVEGATKDGWFKIFRSGGSNGQFGWTSNTSDSDAHSVFARFDSPGTYTIEISGRSAGHRIDRFVLYRSGNGDGGDVATNTATDLSRPESPRVG